jgi:hypothetical protein
MANGKPGDHPLTDILIHRIPVFAPDIDDMIREIDQLGGRREILDRIDWFSPLPTDFEDQIRTSVVQLRQLRREQGWELD